MQRIEPVASEALSPIRAVLRLLLRHLLASHRRLPPLLECRQQLLQDWQILQRLRQDRGCLHLGSKVCPENVRKTKAGRDRRKLTGFLLEAIDSTLQKNEPHFQSRCRRRRRRRNHHHLKRRDQISSEHGALRTIFFFAVPKRGGNAQTTSLDFRTQGCFLPRNRHLATLR